MAAELLAERDVETVIDEDDLGSARVLRVRANENVSWVRIAVDLCAVRSAAEIQRWRERGKRSEETTEKREIEVNRCVPIPI